MSSDRSEDPDFKEWASKIKKRDKYTCQICFRRGTKLHAHHIFSWDKYPNLRFDLENGITLCDGHHNGFHEKYGFGGNDKEQFREYKNICRTLYKIANHNFEIKAKFFDTIYSIKKGKEDGYK